MRYIQWYLNAYFHDFESYCSCCYVIFIRNLWCSWLCSKERIHNLDALCIAIQHFWSSIRDENVNLQVVNSVSHPLPIFIMTKTSHCWRLIYQVKPLQEILSTQFEMRYTCTYKTSIWSTTDNLWGHFTWKRKTWLKMYCKT